MKKFCVITTGRAGSTALMDALATYDDIGLPARQYRSDDNELFNRGSLKDAVRFYSQKLGRLVRSQQELIDAFFETNEGYSYAGFKTMPNRHKSLQIVSDQPGLQTIVLYRADIPSTVASFIVATRHKTWRRSGEAQQHHYRYQTSDDQFIGSNTAYVRRSIARLKELTGVIELQFENLCTPGYRCAPLDEFFGRPVTLTMPRPPVSGQTYVENWDEFRTFVLRAWLDNGGSEEDFEPSQAG